ncbi:MAG: AMP-binding protein, partial [Steroidobacteraceae bacterium]
MSGGVNFDLLVSVVERAEGPRLQIEYNTVLFEKRRIRHLIGMYTQALDAVMENDGLRVSEFPLLAGEEKAVLEAAGAGPSPFDPGAHSIPAWLDRWTLIQGAAAAIVSGNERVSWKALQSKSLEFSLGLWKSGVRAGQTVAVRMEPSADAAAAVLAVLRIGAVVLPIPQTTSAAEWNLILLELQPAMALAQQAFSEKFAALTGFAQLEKAASERSPGSNVQAAAASDAAWLNVRTDPSGHYQATAFSHEATLRSMLGAARTLDMRRGDAVLVWPAEASADAWTDLLLPMLAGASTIHAGGAAQEMQSLVDREQAVFALATPAQFAQLPANGWR